MVPLHCPGGFDTTGISPVSPPLPPFFLLIERKIYCQTMTSEKRTDRTDALGLPCARMSMVARVSGKRTNYSAISKNFFHATVQQNRLTLQTENKSFRKHLCIRAISRHLMFHKHFGRTVCCALPCTAVRLSPAPPRKGGEGGNSNACNKFGPPPSPPFRAVHLKWEKWIFHMGEGCPGKLYMAALFPFFDV